MPAVLAKLTPGGKFAVWYLMLSLEQSFTTLIIKLSEPSWYDTKFTVEVTVMVPKLVFTLDLIQEVVEDDVPVSVVPLVDVEDDVPVSVVPLVVVEDDVLELEVSLVFALSLITDIVPVKTLDTVADTNGAELVCSRWLSISTT